MQAGLDAAAVDAWRDAELAALDALAPWLRQRAEAGFVRRAHGDLHLGNLCLWQGRPVPFDALEFDETLATIDLAYDLAFLLMDLDRRVSRAAANRVMNRYVARTGDVGLTRGLPAFLSMRAMVRAHVEARSVHADRVQPYLDAALAYLRPVPAVVVAIGGLPGSGKSTLARALAPALGRAPGALVLRSDEIRKRQHGVAPEQRLPQEAYSEAASQTVFATLAADSGRVAAGGHCVLADATFMDGAAPSRSGTGNPCRRRGFRRPVAAGPDGGTGTPGDRAHRRCVRCYTRGAASGRAARPRCRVVAADRRGKRRYGTGLGTKDAAHP